MSGVQKNRSYINITAHPKIAEEALRKEFTDKDGDGISRYLIYDWGSGDTVTVPSIVSATNTSK